MRFCCLLLATLPSLLLVPGRGASPPTAHTARPRLAVLIVFDQMRGDYPSRWQKLYGEGGFRRLAEQGAWFQNCHYPYALTITAPGHATLATGCPPCTHGIIGNEWFDRKAAATLNCVATTRYQPLPLPPPPEKKDDKSKPTGAAPPLLLSPTLADALKDATSGKARVVALSIKDRSSVLPGGQRPDVCLWLDDHGRVVTSLYYRETEVPWARAFNASGYIDRWFGKQWYRLRPELDYVAWSGFDDMPGEGTGKHQGRTFPHPFDGGPKKSKKEYYKALKNSPFGNDVLLELARRAIEAEKLGSRPTPDFLSISFSSNDLVGHTWGPDSQEVLDTTLRSDRIMRDLMALLDEKVGKGKWVLALSADHGVCMTPEVARSRGIAAKRVPIKAFVQKIEDHLNAAFPPPAGEKSKAKWIESNVSLMLYLNRKTMAARGVARPAVEKVLLKWLREHPAIHSAYTHAELRTPARRDDVIGQRVRLSFHPERSGDVTLVFKPYCLPEGDYTTGTTHGSPHDYDRHVPLMVIGPGIRPGVRKDSVSPEHTAVILARALGIKPPAHARVGVPVGLFE